MKLSVTIIAKNEEESIGACLESVAWADEIIVIDSGSTDATVDRCRKYTDKVYVMDWIGHGPQKNRALNLATGDWVLALDADEWVTPELKDEIVKVINNPGDPVAFEMPRLSSYCGQYIHHSGWWPDRITRLFKNGKARFNDHLIHDKLIVDGSIGRLSNHLMHRSFRNIDHMLDKLNRYSTGGARVLLNEGEKSSLTNAILHGFWSFFYTYFVRAGFLDGRMGFMLAVSNAEGTYYKYLKLMLMTKDKK
ncbi:MAG TPA: glycosyltransferase family 2 protein [Smithellaceae bacterium]|jgi:glycosyltransferase involved in cell wall biosynthesis|nr:glycosyltransferase family 2 protein [Smithellaceae bacterium]